MDLAGIITSVENWGVAEWMRSSLKAMPFVEAAHVLTAAMVFGTILIVDLRLLGFPSTRRSVKLIEGELLKYTWAAFIVSVITGALMFAANATTYYGNTAFRLKMLALLAAGVNMAVFELITVPIGRGLGQGQAAARNGALRRCGIDRDLGGRDLPGALDRLHEGLQLRRARQRRAELRISRSMNRSGRGLRTRSFLGAARHDPEGGS